MRILTDEEVKELSMLDVYPELPDLANIFQHAIVENEFGTVRWKTNKLIDRFTSDPGGYFYKPSFSGNSELHRGVICLNQLRFDASGDLFSLEEYMKFYMQLGYSIDGYYDVFAQCEVTQYGLPYLSPPPEDFNFNESYYQTPIDYMIEKYAGQTLRL